MDRRGVMRGLGVGLAFAVLPALAQQPKVWRIGFLQSGSGSSVLGKRTLDGVVRALRDAGYVEGRNAAFEVRSAESDYSRLATIAAELVGLKCDVLIGPGILAVRAFAQATSSIPIVMFAVGDPVKDGLVASLSQPGGNITGLSNASTDLSTKYLELLQASVPKVTGVALLGNPESPATGFASGQILASAKRFGMRTTAFQARNGAEIDAAFASMGRARLRALILLPDVFILNNAPQINRLAQAQRIATMYWDPNGPHTGGLMSYGADLEEQWRRIAAIVDKLLKGAKPADIPVESPTRTQLVINVKTAKAIGATIPRELLLRADRVIE